jgi:hypothetical protein
MNPNKLLLITFDYELFLGNRSGRVDDCLIQPTSKLLKLLADFEFKAIFFIDTVYLLQMKKILDHYPKAKSDFECIIRQLIEIVKLGHYIFPHIHGHWLDAEYLPEENQWSLRNTRYYQFASLPTEEQENLFDSSISLLYCVGRSAAMPMKLDSYRAGGWSIQPFHSFKPYFQKYGIRNEFSVLPGRYLFSDAHQFDFRKAPIAEPIYRFSHDVCVKDDSGPYMEWTISSLGMTPQQQWIDFRISGLLHRLRITGKKKGMVISSKTTEEGDIYKGKLASRWLASFEGLHPYRVSLFSKLIQDTSYFQFISHPKLINAYELKMINRLFRIIRTNKNLETDFRKVVNA